MLSKSQIINSDILIKNSYLIMLMLYRIESSRCILLCLLDVIIFGLILLSRLWYGGGTILLVRLLCCANWRNLTSNQYDEEMLQLFEKQRNSIISDKLEHYKELEKEMSFATIEEATKVMNYYVILSRHGLKMEKTDPSRAMYVCQVGCPFKCNLSGDKKGTSEFSIINLISEHTCFACYKIRGLI